jgi:hypothetical protein
VSPNKSSPMTRWKYSEIWATIWWKLGWLWRNSACWSISEYRPNVFPFGNHTWNNGCRDVLPAPHELIYWMTLYDTVCWHFLITSSCNSKTRTYLIAGFPPLTESSSYSWRLYIISVSDLAADDWDRFSFQYVWRVIAEGPFARIFQQMSGEK